MLNRVQQFIHAIFASISAEDRLFIARQLNAEESRLFWRMNLPDQRHVLHVAYTCLRLAKDDQAVNMALLLKCALLHDVGKVKGDVSTADKVVTVLAHQFCPVWSKNWGRMGRGGKIVNLRHAFYIYFHHAARGAAMLRHIGDDAIAAIIEKHHDAPLPDDCLELKLLRTADHLN